MKTHDASVSMWRNETICIHRICIFVGLLHVHHQTTDVFRRDFWLLYSSFYFTSFGKWSQTMIYNVLPKRFLGTHVTQFFSRLLSIRSAWLGDIEIYRFSKIIVLLVYYTISYLDSNYFVKIIGYSIQMSNVPFAKGGFITLNASLDYAINSIRLCTDWMAMVYQKSAFVFVTVKNYIRPLRIAWYPMVTFTMDTDT